MKTRFYFVRGVFNHHMVSGRNPSFCSTCVYTGMPEVTEVVFSVEFK
jgi:hypothetical protein